MVAMFVHNDIKNSLYQEHMSTWAHGGASNSHLLCLSSVVEFRAKWFYQIWNFYLQWSSHSTLVGQVIVTIGYNVCTGFLLGYTTVWHCTSLMLSFLELITEMTLICLLDPCTQMCLLTMHMWISGQFRDLRAWNTHAFLWSFVSTTRQVSLIR